MNKSFEDRPSNNRTRMNFIILVVLIAALAASDAVQAKLPMRRGFHDRQRNQGGKYGGQRMSYAEAARAQHRNHENIGAARAQHENIAARLQEMNLENQVRGQQYDDGYDVSINKIPIT